jgi:uncharacterized protein
MIIKIHKTEDGKLMLAVCDSDLINKKFEEGNKQLDLSSDFYKGEEKSNLEIKKLIKNAYILNIVGKNSINFAINENFISGDYVEEIAGIPYAQSVCPN